MLTSDRQSPTNRPSPAGAGAMSMAPRRSALPGNIDWLGVIVRHKSLLLLAVVIASILGYVHYTRQQPVYGSALKVMITTQAPPTIVQGEQYVQPTSVGRYQNLLVSELVLTKAVEDGKLKELETFRGDSAPAASLSGMLSVVPVQGASDMYMQSACNILNVSIKGPQPHELPGILTEVVAAFQEILTEDAADLGKTSVELITKLQEQISEAKLKSEERYFELIQKLGITADPTTGQFINPYAAESTHLQGYLAETQREFRAVEERVTGIRKLQDMPAELRTDMLKAVALEASKYLELSARDEASLDVPGNELTDRRGLMQRIGIRTAELESRIAESQARLDRMKRSAGINHPTVIALANEVAIANSQLTALLTQRSRLQEEISAEETSSTASSDAKKPATLVLNQFDRDLIMIYLASLDREKERLQKSMDAISIDVALADGQAASVAKEIDELNVLSREIERKDTVIREMLDRLSEMTVLASNHTSTKVRVIDSPGVGGRVEPKLLNFMLISVFLGAAIGMGLGALLDWTELSFHNPDEIQEKLATYVLARIPTQKLAAGKGAESDAGVGLVTVTRPQSAVAEAYRTCRTAMLFTAKQQGNKIFLITSPSAGDGKSTTATNIAMSLAQGGYKTVLVDADLRRPRCHVYLGEVARPGIKEFSQGLVGVEDVIHRTSLHANLSFVGTSKALEEPSEFLESKAFEELILTLQKDFDFVIIDSPPVVPVADALALSSRSDAVLLVLRVRKGVVLAAQKAMENLRSVEANVIGVVVNSVDKASHYSDYGRYGYKGYGGYNYYAQRYYGKQNAMYYREEANQS